VPGAGQGQARPAAPQPRWHSGTRWPRRHRTPQQGGQRSRLRASARTSRARRPGGSRRQREPTWPR
jgi:hypothetical protein